ncbi:MAG TPA: hypothetical protein VFR03_07480 [Thermoanaerobaculia bacterium]|nr:hypothetical protein [Thermoanaerobaculia bacterium]
MTRFKLLLVAAALLTATVAVRPAESDCILQGLCRPCAGPTPGYAQPCKYNPCTGEYICGSCVNPCFLPPT